MGGLVARTKQGIRIRTRKIVHTKGGVERESRVTVEVDDRAAAVRDIKLGVRIANGQRLTKFQWPDFDVLSLRRDSAVEEELRGVDRFRMDGETWVAWRIPARRLPGLGGFRTAFGLSPAIPQGQTVMWAVVYEGEGFAGEHVFIGYADVTPPDQPRATPKRRRASTRATKRTRKKR